MVVAFVEGLSSEFEGKVAYVTHVPSGSQIVLNPDGEVVDRHDGRGNRPGRLDVVLAHGAAMERIMEGLHIDVDLRPRESAADWIHSVQFGGITYLAKGGWGGHIITEGERALDIEDLGPELYRVAFRIDGYGGHPHQDGDATYLNPGTPVYQVKGYTPEFRLAALEDGEVRLFEADTNMQARIDDDLLDLRDKVVVVDILSAKDRSTVLGTIEDERNVKSFVERVLESPVDQGSRDRERVSYFLAFRLADGTSAVRAFWLESGELSRGIMTDPTVTLSVWSNLGEEDRSVATGEVPGISERLAARLGLAYLSYPVPELNVTAKPHSPVVRLMRRSEFEAMTGSVSTISSDPLVWVVEANGSWPTGGIVSGNQEDLQVGLVAFDADTSSEYGVSYRNESLLGTPNRPQPVTSGATAMPASTPPPEHSAADLAAWYEHVKETVWQVPGIAWSNLSESNNRIEIGLRPLRGVRERFEAILGTLDVPRKAIVIEVGCERVGQWPQEISEASEDSFFRAIDYSLDVVSQVSYGETVRIKLTLRNITGEPAKVALGGKPAYDFVVTTTDGEGVWKWKCGGITLDVLDSETLEPGEGLEFIGEWEQVDNRGEPVSPGIYLVRGHLDVGRPSSGAPDTLVTAAHELEVLR